MVDDEGEETGDIEFNIKMPASGVSKKTGRPWARRPVLVDAALNPIDPRKVKIGGGTRGAVSFEFRPYSATTTTGAGVSLRMVGVQVIDLVQFGQKDPASLGFGAVAGGFTAASVADDEDEADDDDDSPYGEASEDVAAGEDDDPPAF